MLSTSVCPTEEFWRQIVSLSFKAQVFPSLTSPTDREGKELMFTPTHSALPKRLVVILCLFFRIHVSVFPNEEVMSELLSSSIQCVLRRRLEGSLSMSLRIHLIQSMICPIERISDN